MISLINGKPVFYIGKINGLGYISEKDKEILIKQLKEDNPDIEIEDEKLEIDEDLRRKAEELAKLKLTYSKSEFMQYLNGEKTHNLIELAKLKEENKVLSQALVDISLATGKENAKNEAAIVELAMMLNSLGGNK